jgi:hypothetical protein
MISNDANNINKNFKGQIIIENSNMVSNDVNNSNQNFKGRIVKYINDRKFGFIKT